MSKDDELALFSVTVSLAVVVAAVSSSSVACYKNFD